jgi:hypothetical protein
MRRSEEFRFGAAVELCASAVSHPKVFSGGALLSA